MHVHFLVYMQDASWRYIYRHRVQHVTYHDQRKYEMIRLKESSCCASLLKLTACNRTSPFNKESVMPRDFLLDDQALVSWPFKRDLLKIVAFQQNKHTAFIILQTQTVQKLLNADHWKVTSHLHWLIQIWVIQGQLTQAFKKNVSRQTVGKWLKWNAST